MRIHKSLPSWLEVTLFCLVALCGIPAFASQPDDDAQSTLAGLGLDNLEVISDSQADGVRGQGIGSSGTSLLIGSLVDPATGSTANFFQIQSSGATGATASHSNMINASFGWTIGGILQRFQAEIGGFGYAFAR